MEPRVLSRDAAAAVRRFCYNNLHEFHDRHVARYEVSYQSFLRVMNGERTTEETMFRILSALRDLNLLDAEGLPTHLDSLYAALYKFTKLAERVIGNPNHENLKAMNDEVSAVKQLIRPYVTL